MSGNRSTLPLVKSFHCKSQSCSVRMNLSIQPIIFEAATGTGVEVDGKKCLFKET